MDIHVHEQRLPGISLKYDIDLSDGRSPFVSTSTGGEQAVCRVTSDGKPDWQVSLRADQAVTIAALLLGARFTLDSRSSDQIGVDEIIINTMTAGSDSQIIGLSALQMNLLGDTAFTMAVISATAPEVKTLDTQRCHFGDWVVFAASASDAPSVINFICSHNGPT